MTRNKTNETIVKLFAKAMFYGDWKWETPNERVITMLMQEIGMLGFKDEDEMIAKTKVKEKLYRKAIKLIPSVPCEINQSKTDEECEDISINVKVMETLLSRVEKERVNYPTAEHAAIDHLKMASAHLFEETEGRDLDNWLSDIDKIIKKLEDRA